MNLKEKRCKPLESDEPGMTEGQIEEYLQHIQGWKVEDNRLTKQFNFNDFREAMGFINKIAEVAESEQHHPDIFLHYSQVNIELWTHAINGLSENDFIVAAKIDALL